MLFGISSWSVKKAEENLSTAAVMVWPQISYRCRKYWCGNQRDLKISGTETSLLKTTVRLISPLESNLFLRNYSSLAQLMGDIFRRRYFLFFPFFSSLLGNLLGQIAASLHATERLLLPHWFLE